MWTCCEERVNNVGCCHESELSFSISIQDRQNADDRQRSFLLGLDSDGEPIGLDTDGYDSEDWCADNCGCGYYGGGQPYCLGKSH